MASAPVSGFSVTCWLLFAAYAGCKGYYYHLQADFYPHYQEYYETQRNLCFAVGAMLLITTFVFYHIYSCLKLQTFLILRLLGNLAAMVVFLGYEAKVLSEDGLDQEAIDYYSFDNMSDWGSTIAWSCAWLFIAAFEINEASFCSRKCLRWVVKFQCLMFWVLLAIAFGIPGEELLDQVDLKDSENVYSKLLIATAGAGALAAFLFACYCTCEVDEFLKLHMVAGGLTVALWSSSFGYQSYETRKMYTETTCESSLNALTDNRLCKHKLLSHNVYIAAYSMITLALVQVVGFNNYFFASQQKRDPASAANPAIQIIRM